MSLLSLFGMGSRESLQPAPYDEFWYSTIGGSAQTTSGMRVDEGVALNYSVCWACTRLLAGTAGWLPFNLYKRLPSGGANIASTHRVHRLIHDQPNGDMGAMMFRSRGVNHQVNWGNTYSEIVRTYGGLVDRLEPIHPRRVPAKNIKRENGKLVYYVNPPDGLGTPVAVPQENMFHVPSIISDDGIIGKGVVAAARESIGKAMGSQMRNSSALKNGGAPPLALKGGKFKDKAEREEYRRQINEIHGGPDNAGKWLLLPPDAEVQMLGFSLQDSQFVESMQFDVEELCRWYGCPPHLVQNLLRATFNNIEELGISFVKYSLIQWLKLWEQEVWRKLLTPAEQNDYYAKFVVDALERGNMQTRTEAGVKKFFNGLWTLNQWAEQEDMNPILETTVVDGETINLGDVHLSSKP
jgi:HK97 family phage portal protein